MSLLPFLLALPILLVDGGLAAALASELGRDAGADAGPADPGILRPLLAACLAPVVAAIAAAAVSRFALARIDAGGPVRWLGRADRTLVAGRWLILVGHAASIVGGGWLAAVRSMTGDLILLDEVLACVPAVAGFAALWAIAYDLERRVRDAVRMRRFDEGRPIWPTPTRGDWVLGNLRLQVLLLGVPIALVMGANEAIRVWRPLVLPDSPRWIDDTASLAAGLTVFVLAPLLMRLVLPVRALGAGRLRADVDELCRGTGVRISQVMLWRTGGTQANAAVMGLVPMLRYVLLTDALVEEIPRPALRGVIAHELGHVRHRHMPWLVATLAGLLLLGGAAAGVPAAWMVRGGADPAGAGVTLAAIAGAAVALVAAAIGFGWVSRRYERQADVFAVQVLSREVHDAAAAEQAETEARGTFEVRAEAASAPLTDRDPDSDPDPDPDSDPDSTTTTAGAGAVVPAVAADAGDATAAATRPRIQASAVAAMAGALTWTAQLNAVDSRRPSWRHGSIDWRRRALAATLGEPVGRQRIDAVVGRLKIAAAVAVVAGFAATAGLEAWAAGGTAAEARTARGITAAPAATGGAHAMTTATAGTGGPSIPFVKMHGLGNDYVYVDGFAVDVPDPAALARRVSDRRRGIGSDGLILLLPPRPADDAVAGPADLAMRMFNADGSEAEMCGNGIRCVARLAVELGRAAGPRLVIDTGAGRLVAEVLPPGDRVTVEMGRAGRGAAAVGLDAAAAGDTAAAIGSRGDDAAAPWRLRTGDPATDDLAWHPVSMGNPHVTAFLPSPGDVAAARLDRIGPAIERHAAFPARINVHLAAAPSRDRLVMRTWERGSGLTDACGTGACAVAAAAADAGLTGRCVAVALPGGTLEIDLGTDDASPVRMTGPATRVFDGILPVD